MRKIWKISFACTFILLMFSCEDEQTWIPKPTGFMRRNFPAKNPVVVADSNCPYTFKLVDYATVKSASGGIGCHKDIRFEDFKCEINMSYLPVDSNLFQLTEYIQKRIGEHTAIAQAIVPIPYQNDSTKTYGVFYRLDGDVALNGAFYLTDSTNHFVSGLMSFDVAPNFDSLRPSLMYVSEDIDNMLSSFRWINK